MATVDWKWFLAEPEREPYSARNLGAGPLGPLWEVTGGQFAKFNNIGVLSTAQGRKISMALNSPESASFTINLLEPIASQIRKVRTCLVCYRNGELVWSGPVWTTQKQATADSRMLNVTCTGWLQLLLERRLLTGAVGNYPLHSVGIRFGGSRGTSTATEQHYNLTEPQDIARDLVALANYSWPTLIRLGLREVNPEGPILWNVTYRLWQNIGQAIQTLSNTENGFDFRVNPETLAFDNFYHRVKGGTTIFGRGQDRPEAQFGFKTGPSNLASLGETEGKLTNQFFASGQFGETYSVDSFKSVEEQGLFQEQQSLSEVVSQPILEAFAADEVAIYEHPQKIVTFNPMAFNSRINVPQPFVDYDIGDIVYVKGNHGALQVEDGSGGPQPCRVFSYELDLDDEGNEHVTNVQTVNSAK